VAYRINIKEEADFNIKIIKFIKERHSGSISQLNSVGAIVNQIFSDMIDTSGADFTKEVFDKWVSVLTDLFNQDLTMRG